MKILFLSTTFPDAGSPTRGTYNAALCRALARDHEVRVISPRMFTEVEAPFRRRTPKRCPQDLVRAGIVADYPTYWYTPKCFQSYYGAHMWWSLRSQILRTIHEFQPHVVLSYWAHPDGEAGLRAARAAGVPSAVIVGGTDVLLLPKMPRRGRRIRQVLIHSSAVIAVSDQLRNATIELGVPGDQVHAITQGIDPVHFHTHRTREESRRRLGLDPTQSHLLWVGRMAPVKALDVLIDAAAILRQQGVNFVLHLAGNGSCRVRLEQRVAAEGLQNCVHFTGAVAHDALPDWYRAADLTVLSSDSEGLPNVLRESLACGTPFVSTDVGGIREIARDEYATLVPTRDPRALAEGIMKTLTPEHREAAAMYQPRTWSDCARDTAALLESLTGRRSELLTMEPRLPAPTAPATAIRSL